MKNITTQELVQLINGFKETILIDVRTTFEHKNASITPSINIPLPILIEDHQELLRLYEGYKIVLYCNIGVKSGQAASLLESLGRGYELYNLKGGIVNWLEHHNH